ncbi:hypothetical protein A9K65_034440 (plasmid) [Mesorhizobium sp. WSM1497]|nr:MULTISPECIES: hypothetical protein [unclassified Mesorhizobium]RUY10551.1 hypothetical protein EN991_27145 [Mesorhizobium sp. M7A.F.Ca.US.005.03.2.1]RUY20184.1 hypothetical protein EN979_36720 [Mesorhizobium sp. M7A.F.Ca.US.001.04.2.1]ARP68444.1 hypothetical protein A9K65_034440 [Mesorhizobium sp. WSM1497]RUX72352.1 hypothetical protein EN990_25315 [Mesorhizobium sp. M7A.F.Ca.US.005.03.1.1]RUY38730.1 hypothetical protein EN978_23320 [Mesorhizobium sp. M7A.F.Ca.US.001.04.1.1]
MLHHEIGTVSDWSKLVADDPLIAADIAQRLSVLACNDKSTAAHVQSPSAVRFRGSDLTSLAAPTEYPRPIVLLATICGSTVVGITLLLAAAV